MGVKRFQNASFTPDRAKSELYQNPHNSEQCQILAKPAGQKRTLSRTQHSPCGPDHKRPQRHNGSASLTVTEAANVTTHTAQALTPPQRTLT